MAIEDGYMLAEMVAQVPDDLTAGVTAVRAPSPSAHAAGSSGGARAGKEMHLTSKWAQIKRNVRLAWQHQIGGDKTGLKLTEFYEYDVAAASRLVPAQVKAQ